MNRASLEDNPFLVLGVPTTATRLDVERAGQKLLGLLAIGSAAARTYPTPFGPKPRDEDKVRTALAALRDPEERVLAELWVTALADDESGELPRWSEALESVGWRGPCTD